MDKILIIGLGRSGLAAAELLRNEASVSIWDSKPEEKLNKDDVALLRSQGICCYFGDAPDAAGWDKVVLSPGVPVELPFVREARLNGAEISGELEQAYEHCRGRFIAITGTNGKTTVTTLVGEMVKAAGLDCRVAGNIGIPLASLCADAGPDTLMVTEVSSFQLETADRFHPFVSAVLNVTPDHLDRHKTFERYADLKASVTKNQTKGDYFIYNYSDEHCQRTAAYCKARAVPFFADGELAFGAFCLDGRLFVRDDEGCAELCRADELQIPGHHNLENALAAAACAYFAGVPADAISRTLREFKGVEHRIELICERKGVRYINDSKGTNPDSSIKAIEAVNTPILLIAGGYEKNSDFTEFIESFNGKVKDLLLIGATAKRFADTAIDCGFPKDRIFFCDSMKECVQKASLLAEKGDTVLLSPASASWGMYNNYEERGDDFRRLALALDD
ncbi:MAG: UDP-N-acetylmuramoyl-L-alanine--D-glutamate ligase [Firmicutes bacterium]|nr:UDP-N-acetylmuramoyl-L-alanine--D-glutamate ligase [Bacillota bacterium]